MSAHRRSSPPRGSRDLTWLKQLGVVIAGCIAAAIMIGLGLWQLRVFDEQGVAASAARAAEPARDLAAVAPVGSSITDGYGRTVRATGSYLPQHQVLVPLEGDADRRRVVAAFRTDTGSVVAVVRGTVAVGQSVPSAPQGTTIQDGLLLPTESAAGSAPPPSAGELDSIRLPVLAQTWPAPLVEGYVLLDPAQARQQGLDAAPLVLPEGQGRLRNGAYALQWWVFAAFAIAMSVRMARDLRAGTELDMSPVDPR